MMHPWSEGNIAAARRDIARCLDAIKAAIKVPGDDEAWKHIGVALGYAAQVQAQLDDAMTVEEMAVVAAGDEP